MLSSLGRRARISGEVGFLRAGVGGHAPIIPPIAVYEKRCIPPHESVGPMTKPNKTARQLAELIAEEMSSGGVRINVHTDSHRLARDRLWIVSQSRRSGTGGSEPNCTAAAVNLRFGREPAVAAPLDRRPAGRRPWAQGARERISQPATSSPSARSQPGDGWTVSHDFTAPLDRATARHLRGSNCAPLPQMAP